MKTPRPGQLVTINETVYRAKKRTRNCDGCALNDYFRCPNIVDSRNGVPLLDCKLKGIILVKI